MYKKYGSENGLLKIYNWWYFPDFPNDLMAELSLNSDIYSTQKVNERICQYYNANEYAKIKALIVKWIGIKFFSLRRIDIEELIIIHQYELYNAAITLSMTIIEGVIRDYIRDKKGSYYQFKTVRENFKNIVDSCNDFFDDELDIINDVILSINAIYEGKFSPLNPEEYSDLLRDKRMHGQAYDKQTEINSLKMILLMDELFYMISVIEEEYS